MGILFILIVIAVAVAVIVSLSKRIASHSFKCNSCEQEFKIKWTKVIFTVHSGNEYLLVCPHCKNKGWCTKKTEK